ncbi:MAG: hypothetical protein R3Y24_16215 [Eubacteriales bacterium]
MDVLVSAVYIDEEWIYYTTLDESGIQSYSCENDITEYMLEAYKI